MAGMIRLIIAGAKPGVVTYIKNGLLSKPNIEMIIAVDRPSEAENKISRNESNVLLTDLDNTSPEIATAVAMQQRLGVELLYTAVSSTRGSALPQGLRKNFVLKPAVFTQLTATRFADSIYVSIAGSVKKAAPPEVRFAGKTSGPGSKVIAVASSTGGTTALEKLFDELPNDMPPILIVQHMPSGFTHLFANRLNAVYKLDIREARTGDYLRQGQVLFAPSGSHMRLIKQSGLLVVDNFVSVKINGVMPAADILFESLAEHVRSNAIGVILTGMGADGARGMLLMHSAGAKTIGQDKDTSVVYGMPKVARDLGAVDFELPLNKIADKLISLAKE